MQSNVKSYHNVIQDVTNVERRLVESTLEKKGRTGLRGGNLALYSEQHLSSTVAWVTQCNALVFLPK